MADVPESLLPRYRDHLGCSGPPFVPSDSVDIECLSRVKELQKNIEELRDDVKNFREAITRLPQSGTAAIGLEYVSAGFLYLEAVLIKQLESPAYVQAQSAILWILSRGLEDALTTSKATGLGEHGECMLKHLREYLPDFSGDALSQLRRDVRERYDPHVRPPFDEQIIVDLFDSYVGLSQFKRTFETMPFISRQPRFRGLCEGIDLVCAYIKDGSYRFNKHPNHQPDNLAAVLSQFCAQMDVLRSMFQDFAKEGPITEELRSVEEKTKRITQDGIMITLVAAIAAQSVAFVLPTPSTNPILDTAAAMLLLSAIIFAVCGVLAQSSAHSRVYSQTALPTRFMKPKYITEIAHRGQSFGLSYNLAVLFTVAGLTCFGWMRLHPAPTGTPIASHPPLSILVIFFTIVCIPAAAAVLAFVIRYAWHRYERVYSRYSREIYACGSGAELVLADIVGSEAGAIVPGAAASAGAKTVGNGIAEETDDTGADVAGSTAPPEAKVVS
ncbi:unnamed protein product [Tilletia controversa]|nr:unnamed protein product [Tilletia controversa]